MKKIYLVFLLLFMTTISQAQDWKTNEELAVELMKLKNQAFCDCFIKVTEKEPVKYKDGSTYVQIIGLRGEYVFQYEKYWKMIEEWSKKEYKSYNPENNLYLMQCLDFYNSKILKDFIDDVKLQEIRLQKEGK